MRIFWSNVLSDIKCLLISSLDVLWKFLAVGFKANVPLFNDLSEALPHSCTVSCRGLGCHTVALFLYVNMRSTITLSSQRPIVYVLIWSIPYLDSLTLPLQVDFTNPRPREPFSLMPVTWKPSPRMLLLLTCQWHFERSFKWGSWRHVYHRFWDGCSRIDPEQKSSIASCTYGLMTASSCMIRVCAIDQGKGWVILGRSQMLSDTQEGKGVRSADID